MRILSIIILIFLFSNSKAQYISPYILTPTNTSAVVENLLLKVQENEFYGKLDICDQLFLNSIDLNKSNSSIHNQLKYEYASFLIRNIYADKGLEVLKELIAEGNDEFSIYAHLLLANIYVERGKESMAKLYLVEAQKQRDKLSQTIVFTILENIVLSSLKEFNLEIDSSIKCLEIAATFVKDSLENNNFNSAYRLNILNHIADLRNNALNGITLPGQTSSRDYYTYASLIDKIYDELNYTNLDSLNSMMFFSELRVDNYLHNARVELNSTMDARDNRYPGTDYNRLQQAEEILNMNLMRNPRRYLYQYFEFNNFANLEYEKFAILYDEMSLFNKSIDRLNDNTYYKNFLLSYDSYKYFKPVIAFITRANVYSDKDNKSYIDGMLETLNSLEEKMPLMQNELWAIFYYNKYKDEKVRKGNTNSLELGGILEKSMEYFDLFHLKRGFFHPYHYLVAIQFNEFIKDSKYNTILNNDMFDLEYLRLKMKLDSQNYLSNISYFKKIFDDLNYVYLYDPNYGLIHKSKNLETLSDLYYEETCSYCSGRGDIKRYDLNGNDRGYEDCPKCSWGSITRKRYKTDNSFLFLSFTKNLKIALENHKALY